MHDLFFYLFAALTLLCGLMVVVNPFSRNPVTSAMFLVLTIISMAGLFVLLHAFFLAAVQVLVYAGAVMVLFLFVIMLLDLKEEQLRHFKTFGAVSGLASVGALAAIAVTSILRSGFGPMAGPQIEGTTPALEFLFLKTYITFLELAELRIVATNLTN